ncbi:MAG: putative peptidase [Anaerolineales bacterium]|nr:putative peptidase [Anaerolineales bacterium]
MKSDIDALMQARNLDALLVLGSAEHNPSMYYFTGGGHVSGAVLIKKRGAAPILFCNDMEREEAAKTGLEIRSLSLYPVADLLKEAEGDMTKTGAILFKRLLTDLGLTNARLAVYGKVEFASAFGTMTRLQTLLPNLQLIGENDSIFIRAMETKEESEVARIRRMGQVTTQIVRLTQEYLTSREVRADEVLLKEDGTPLTIGDVHGKIRLWAAERGVEFPEGFIFSIGRDAGLPHSTGNPDDLMRLGQTIVYDIYPAERGGGYFYDFTRTWTLGYASPEAEEMYAQVKDIFDQLMDNFDLNAPFKDYQRITCEYFESKGHKTQLNTKAPLDGYVHSLGHGVGLNIHERPGSHLTASDDNRLTPGVVITSEPGLYYPEKGMGFRIEDTIWVRPDGVMEILAEYPYDFVLPMKKWKRA